MKVTLTEAEIRGALIAKAKDSLNNDYGFEDEYCYFDITDETGRSIALGEIEFTCSQGHPN